MRYHRLTVIATTAVLLCLVLSNSVFGQSQAAKVDSARRVVVSVEGEEPLVGNLIKADAEVLQIEVEGILQMVALDKVTMIVFAPKSSKAIVEPSAETSLVPPPSSAGEATASPSATGGPVNVRGYYRKDGTYVRPHTRNAPRRRP